MAAAGADTAMPDYLDTPDYTDSESNPTGANSVAGDAPANDNRKKRWEGNALRKSVFGKKHD
ncbi:chromatin remodeling complex Adenosinetriphosphatase, partial [Oleoguttula sp. CCFEE 5521]